MNRSRQSGVALVITLIMLSVVTFMAVTFLALSRRERNAVAVTSSQSIAAQMADIALARAEGEIASRVMLRQGLATSYSNGVPVAVSNLLSTELIVSTNLIDRRGFDASMESLFDRTRATANVNYDYTIAGAPLNANERASNVTRLQYDARVPVYIPTNSLGQSDFRFYLDFNRNGRYDTNGWVASLDGEGRWLGTNHVAVGDPEWIGVLERPNERHSPNNRFIGRYAYLVLPSGRSLDLNFMHNHSRLNVATNLDGFARNQGVGTWELNLAAFFRDLNTNQWGGNLSSINAYYYNTNTSLSAANGGLAFKDAHDLLQARYQGKLTWQPSIAASLGTTGAVALANNFADDFGSGPRVATTAGLTADPERVNNKVTQPWPGGDSTNLFYDVQELLDTTKLPAGFIQRLQGTYYTPTAFSSYDRETFYRLLSQIGVDSSATPLAGKMNINYQSDARGLATNFVRWTPLGFFTNAAARLLSAQPELAFNRPNFALTNIPVYPVNYYTPGVHRLLQLAANIYDATTNRMVAVKTPSYPFFPSVFRPVFRRTDDQVVIAGYVEETNANFVSLPWVDLSRPASRTLLRQNVIETNYLVYGVPLVIGAKRGWPNFNEFSMQTAVQVSRKLQLRKNSPLSYPVATNQMYVLGISNAFGLESWNSYTQAFPRALSLAARVQFDLSVTNRGSAANLVYVPVTNVNMVQVVPAGSWTSKKYLIPVNTNFVTLPDAGYVSRPTPRFVYFSTNLLFEATTNFAMPELGMKINARMQYWVIDTANNKVVDFVNLANLGSEIDLTQELVGNVNYLNQASADGAFWQTNRFRNSGLPVGVREQILTSLGEGTNGASSTVWIDYNGDPVAGRSRNKAIDLFRAFVGLTPFNYSLSEVQSELGKSVTHQAPFSPVRKIYQQATWQANDPLVHYLAEDLIDLQRTNNIQYAVPPTSVPTNSNLGALNRRYRPWGGNPNISSDNYASDMAVKDPLVRQSDDWNFPTNSFPSIGWLGRVHRGTPWQTVYLKSTVANTNDWATMAGPAKARLVSGDDFYIALGNGGNYFTHPTNDWRLLDFFTTAPNDNAARGRLSVNQEGTAAWSAVLSGVSVLTNSASDQLAEIVIEPNSRQLRQIVEDINRTRLQRRSQTYGYLGEVLAAPSLSTNSPYLNLTGKITVSDEVVERIPQQIASLLKSDEPSVTIYTYGQTLMPAANSLLLSGPSRGLCTNYQVVGEVVSKHTLRFDGPVNRPVAVRERFQYLPND